MNERTPGATPQELLARFDEFRTQVNEVRESLFYVARNMSEAFGDRLSHIESNAHSNLVAAFGHLLTLDNELGSVKQSILDAASAEERSALANAIGSDAAE
jgi:hypothetical protein